MVSEPGIISDLLKERALCSPGAVAIVAPLRTPLTYDGLFRHVREVAGFLNKHGLGRGDRIAIVAPDGPEMATLVLAVSSCASSAPLNPRYRRSEFEFYLSDIGAKALIVPAGLDSPAVAVARERGVRIIRLSPVLLEPAGIFALEAETQAVHCEREPLIPDDVALVLHTSGTTGRPKLIPLTNANLCISARNIAASLQLSSTDRCLNVMPLFHVHGLIGGLLSTMAAGGSVVCTPGFHAERFFEWLQEFQPTWFTAVPAMHQALLARLQANQPSEGRSSALRFIRSCSSALPPVVMARLEQAFCVPVVEAYGMTEAAHQIAINPLPPGERKPGSVGRAAGVEVEIVDEMGQRLPQGTVGEVVIRGPNVVRRNEGVAESEQLVDTDGWLRTGDLGVVDSDGYLFLRGRIREMINRGGEKISPREVEDVILNHPAVQEAAVFALPDANLGQVVAVALRLRPNAHASANDIQEFVNARLADFKVPRRVIFVDEIPKAATGKVQRTNLAEKLGLLDSESFPPEEPAARAIPTTASEKLLTEIWCQLFGRASVGLHENFFFDLGGDSLLAIEMVIRLEKVAGVRLSGASVMLRPTVAGLALWMDSSAASSLVVPLQPEGSGAPLFCIHGLSGDPAEFFPLAIGMTPSRPVYGLRAPTEATQPIMSSVAQMAQGHIREIRALQPTGPYLVCGHSSGGTFALEVAQQLKAQGEEVALLALFDTVYPGYLRTLPSRSVWRRIPLHLRALRHLSFKEFLYYLGDRLTTVKVRLARIVWRHRFQSHVATGSAIPDSMANIREIHRQMVDSYQPQPYSGTVVLFRCLARRTEADLEWELGWSQGVPSGIAVHEIPGDHGSMLKPPAVSILVERLEAILAGVCKKPFQRSEPPAARPDDQPASVTMSV